TDEQWVQKAKDLYDDGQKERGEDLSALPDADMAGMTGKIDLYFRLRQFDAEKALERVKPQIRERRRLFLFRVDRNFLKVAAAVMLVLLVASAGFFAGSRIGDQTGNGGVTVDRYGNSRLRLSDGTVVTLNHDTRINYPDKFRNDIREVEIEGEAFFEVQPDPERPFVINAGQTTIRVLGTSFNVSAYPGTKDVEVVVESGKVRLSTRTDPSGANGLVLDPGERGIWTGGEGKLRKNRNGDPNFLAWKTRYFVFDGTPLSEVVEQLGRVYRVDIKAGNSQVGQLLLTARFEDRSLDFILKVIALTHELEIIRKDEHFVLQSGHGA
ncbi:MAG: FecR family protein, partial [Mangrovibacterium sp.]